MRRGEEVIGGAGKTAFLHVLSKSSWSLPDFPRLLRVVIRHASDGTGGEMSCTNLHDVKVQKIGGKKGEPSHLVKLTDILESWSPSPRAGHTVRPPQTSIEGRLQ